MTKIICRFLFFFYFFMNRVLLFLFLCLVSCSTARADFVHAYLNTGREYSNPDYGKSSIWVRTGDFPDVFLENRPVEVTAFRVTEIPVEIIGDNDVVISFLYGRNGDHKLNILGVDFVGAAGDVLYSDYHYGTDGGGNTTPMNNVYTLSGVSAGVYTLRCFVCDVVGGDVVNYAAGEISVSGAWRYIADGVYELKNQGAAGSRGWLVFSSQYPAEIKVAASELSGYTSSEYCFPKINYTGVNCRWCLLTSDSGKRYLFSLQDGSFVSKSGDCALLDADNPVPVVVQPSVRDSKYFHIKVFDKNLFLSNNVMNGLSGEQALWVADSDDDGVVFEFVKNLGKVSAAMLANAKEVIEKKESGEFFEWSGTTPWSVVDEADYTSAVFCDKLSGGISYCDYDNVVVDDACKVVLTFCASGSSPLNIRGVEAVDSCGNIVCGDYHVGVAGTQSVDNVYTLTVAEAGIYKIRVYVTSDAGNRLDESSGVVTVVSEEVEMSVFDYDVEFKAEYATLYLGYKVAVPSGVEAYVVSEVSNGWVKMNPLGDVIPAATPVVLKNVGGSSVYTFVYTDAVAEPVETSLLKGSIVDRYVVGHAYVLALGSSGLGFYLAALKNGSFLNNANKAYLPVDVLKSSSQGCTELRFFDDNVTEVRMLKNGNGCLKGVFNLRGECVGETSIPGLYIINGEKLYVK